VCITISVPVELLSLAEMWIWTGTTYGGHTWNLTQGGDKTLALHRTQVDCAAGCSKPADWATAPRALCPVLLLRCKRQPDYRQAQGDSSK